MSLGSMRALLLLGSILLVALVSCAPTATSPAPAPAASSSANSTPAARPGTPIAAASAVTNPEVAAAQTTGGPRRTFRIVPAQSEASYEVQEKFARLPAPSKAVGRTSTIAGELHLRMEDQSRLEDNRFTVDLRTLTSDSGRRDQFIRDQWLESDRYPIAEFTATRVEQLPTGYVEGQEIPLKIVGMMKIRDVTRELTFDARATLQGDTINGTATTFLLMRDFGFDPPDIFGVVSVEDGVTLTVKFTARAD